MSGSKDGAFKNDAKAVAGVDALGNVHVLNTDITGTLEVTGTVNLATEPTIDIGKVDQGTGGNSPWLVHADNSSFPATQSGVWTVGRTWSLLNTTDSVNVGNFPSSQVVSLADNFGRIKNKQFKDTETVLYDIPLTLVNGFTYAGVAAKGTAQTAASWNIIRTSFDANGNPSADQVALGIAWSARATGPWT